VREDQLKIIKYNHLIANLMIFHNCHTMTQAFKELEAERKSLQTRTQELQAQRNSLSKQIGGLKGKGLHAEADAAMAHDDAITKARIEAMSQSEAERRAWAICKGWHAEHAQVLRVAESGELVCRRAGVTL